MSGKSVMQSLFKLQSNRSDNALMPLAQKSRVPHRLAQDPDWCKSLWSSP
jgi:hypothetical protein